MAQSSRPRNLGATILLGLAAGTMPISGCTIIGDFFSESELSPDEQRLLSAAMSENDPILVERYLRRYPTGRVQSLLNAQGPEVLSRLSPDSFREVPDSTLQRLPASILVHLPPEVTADLLATSAGRPGGEDRSEDSYSG